MTQAQWMVHTKKADFEQIAKESKYSIFVYYGIKNFVPFGHYQLMFNYNKTTVEKSTLLKILPFHFIKINTARIILITATKGRR